MPVSPRRICEKTTAVCLSLHTAKNAREREHDCRAAHIGKSGCDGGGTVRCGWSGGPHPKSGWPIFGAVLSRLRWAIVRSTILMGHPSHRAKYNPHGSGSVRGGPPTHPIHDPELRISTLHADAQGPILHTIQI